MLFLPFGLRHTLLSRYVGITFTADFVDSRIRICHVCSSCSSLSHDSPSTIVNPYPLPFPSVCSPSFRYEYAAQLENIQPAASKCARRVGCPSSGRRRRNLGQQPRRRPCSRTWIGPASARLTASSTWPSDIAIRRSGASSMERGLGYARSAGWIAESGAARWRWWWWG